jgi:hypothetical protein
MPPKRSNFAIVLYLRGRKALSDFSAQIPSICSYPPTTIHQSLNGNLNPKVESPFFLRGLISLSFHFYKHLLALSRLYKPLRCLKTKFTCLTWSAALAAPFWSISPLSVPRLSGYLVREMLIATCSMSACCVNLITLPIHVFSPLWVVVRSSLFAREMSAPAP